MRPLDRYGGALLLTSLVAGCSEGGPSRLQTTLELSCSIPVEDILAGARRDGIPALTDPELLPYGGDARYPSLEDRVIGAWIDGEAVAVPERVFWYHEIVNLTLAGSAVAVTHCPLTGSSLAFNRGPVAGAEFGVSGLLYQNNLLMYDRSADGESLWPQMLRGARCGDRDGVSLPMIPVMEMTWGGWLSLHPESMVVSEVTGYGFDYDEYPYGVYNRPNNEQLLFPLAEPLDRRRPPKERALGIPDGDGGVVFPFGELSEQAALLGANVAAAHGQTSEGDFVVFWDENRQGGMAYRPEIDGQSLTFLVEGGALKDIETGSFWTVGGQASGGSLAGRSLEPVAEAFVAYWFAWPAFYPDVDIWTSS